MDEVSSLARGRVRLVVPGEAAGALFKHMLCQVLIREDYACLTFVCASPASCSAPTWMAAATRHANLAIGGTTPWHWPRVAASPIHFVVHPRFGDCKKLMCHYMPISERSGRGTRQAAASCAGRAGARGRAKQRLHVTGLPLLAACHHFVIAGHRSQFSFSAPAALPLLGRMGRPPAGCCPTRRAGRPDAHPSSDR